MNNAPDWVEQMLRDALKSNADRDFEDFEREFDALKDFMMQRNGRAVIVASACLALATSCLRTATNTQPPNEEEAAKLQTMTESLAEILPTHYFTYLPATIAGILLRKDQ